MSAALALYNEGRAKLAESYRIDEVKGIRDWHDAMAAAAKIAKDDELLMIVTEMRVRAERRLGELLADTPKAKGGEHGGRAKIDGSRSEPSIQTPTLADLGIDKKLSMRSQQLASIPESAFEKAVSHVKEVASEVRAAAVLKVTKGEKQEEPPEDDDDFNESAFINSAVNQLARIVREWPEDRPVDGFLVHLRRYLRNFEERRGAKVA
jgi:hypothetical protein